MGVRIAVATVAVALAVAAPARAEWAVQTVGENAAVLAPALTFTASGGAVASYADTQAPRLARRVAGGRWTTCPVGDRDRVGPPLAAGHDRAVVAMLGPARRRVLDIGVIRPGRCRLRMRPIATADRLRDAALAASTSGRFAMVWWEDRGTHGDRVMVRGGRVEGRIGPAVRLYRGRVRSVAAAMNRRGDLVIAVGTRGHVLVRVRRAGRSRFAPVQTIRSQPAHGARIDVVVSGDGSATIGWTAQRRSEGGDAGPVYVEAARLRAGRTRFGAARTLERFAGEIAEEGHLRLATGGRGETLAAWTGAGGIVRAAGATDGDFAGALDVSPPGSALQSLAAAPDGVAVILFDRGPADPPRLSAVHRVPGGTFGPPEHIASGRFGTVAFPPGAAQPEALFLQPGAEAGWLIRSATRR